MKRFNMKTIAILLIAVMVTASFCGCKKQKDAGEVVMKEETGKTENTQGTDEIMYIDASGDGEEEYVDPFAAESILCGGWNVGIAAGAALPEEVQKRFDTALLDYEGMTFRPIALLGSQVVAGTNYSILCMGAPVIPNPVPSLKIVTLYADLQGGAKIIYVKDFNIGDYNTGEKNGSTSDTIVPGGWSVSYEPACELTEVAAEAFAGATEGIIGVSYDPLAVVGNQVVAGMNYAYICRLSPVVPDPVGTLNVVIVYRNLSGESQITSIVPLNLADYAG